MPRHSGLLRGGLLIAALLVFVQWAQAGLLDGIGGGAGAGGSTCDPTIASCAPPSGGCTAAQQALGQCTPGGGGSSGSGGGGTGGGSTGGVGSCTAPGGGGNTGCGGGGAASQGGGTGGGAQVGGGNPINLISGNKHQEETDLAPLPGVLGLEFKRYYNSDSRQRGLTGVGWRSTYETVLVDLGHAIQIIQADGRRLEFTRGTGSQAHLCTSPSLMSDGQVRIEELPGARRQYHWRWTDGRTLTFAGGSGAGQPLQSIAAASGERVTLSYNPMGDLVDVRDPAGRRLSFIYGKARPGQRAELTGIDTPLGRLGYRHDELGRLVQVSQASGPQAAPHLVRTYHYEAERQAGNPHALTGISAGGTDSSGKAQPVQRLSTYAYDEQGRAVLSTKGLPLQMRDGKPVEGTGIEQIQVEYVQKAEWLTLKVADGEAQPRQFGRSVVTNSLGGKTELTSAVVDGHYRLVQSRGVGCSTCGPADMRYGWDAQGRMVRATKLDEQGRPVESELRRYDAYGRLVQLVRQRHDAQGKGQAPQWLERYEYSDRKYPDGSVAVAPQPSLIARPSVVAGKEHQLRIEYNERWQPTRVTEQGYSPIDAKGEPNPSPMERSTSYGYAQINGRSLLAQIDGPLPNGPKADPSDSDVARLQWDESGNQVVQRIEPGNLMMKESREAGTGRVLGFVDADGIPTTYGYGPHWNAPPISIVRADRRVELTLDAQGQVTQASEQNAALAGPASRTMSIERDVAGRVAAVGDAQGFQARTSWDTEGHALVAGLHEPGQAAPLRANYRWFDERGRLIRRLMADGRVDSWSYDEAQQQVSHQDGDDVMHVTRNVPGIGRSELHLTTDGLLRAHWSGRDAAAKTTQRDGAPLIRRDDFGRPVFEWRPESGLILRSFDAADRLTREDLIDRLAHPAGHRTWQFDAAGHVVQRQSFDAAGQVVKTARWSFGGTRVMTEEDGVQRTRYTYDAAGRVAARSVALLDEQGRTAFETTLTTAVDPESGLPATKTLADGSAMLVSRDALGTAQRIERRSAFWMRVQAASERWLPETLSRNLQRWLPSEPIVGDIRFHPLNGITGFAHGNGVAERKGFDIAGRLSEQHIGSDLFDTRYRYGAGPRIRSIEALFLGQPATKTEFDYVGFGSLKPSGPRLVKTILGGGPTAAPVRDGLGRTTNDGSFDYTYTPDGQIATVSRQGRPVARYRYNAQQQRVSKTILDEAGGARTTFYLWDVGRLVAEIDGSGAHAAHVSVQYLYLGDARWRAPIAKIEAAFAHGNETATERVLAVHADHRGAPVAMTDARQQVVWAGQVDTWGFVTVKEDRSRGARMNIRLPGQYFDAETGLHDNWHRSYDARPGSSLRGSYLGPDPIGYPDGPDPYAYAHGDPVNRVDPKGLYEEDIHYYMTFFLAIAAGIDVEAARTIALAAQYVDDNPDTRPLNSGLAFPLSPLVNQQRLLKYHFVLSDSDGKTDPANRNSDYGNPLSFQLEDLFSASTKAPTKCARFQFLGEYLHAFEDTFSHRQKDNVPYDALQWGVGIGHLFGGHNPDYTYNQPKLGWTVNEDRTFAMEMEVFHKLQAYGDPAKAVDEVAIAGVLKVFNSTHENSTDTQEFGKHLKSTDRATLQKLQVLDSALAELGFTGIDLIGAQAYDQDVAAANRNKFLCDTNGVRLDQAVYPGTILPATACP